MFIEPSVCFRNDTWHCVCIGKICSSDLNRLSTRHHKFNYVNAAGYSAHTYHGDIDRMCSLVHHTERDGLDTRARNSARVIGNNRLAAFNVDYHSRKGVYQRNTVRTAALRRARRPASLSPHGRSRPHAWPD